MNCPECTVPMKDTRLTYRFSVGGTSFSATVGGARCHQCGASAFDGPDCIAAEQEVARRLALRGPASADGFTFLRTTLGMSAQDLAPLLGRRPEALSRWENGRNPIDPPAWALLGSLVLDKLDGVGTTLARLKTLASGKPAPKTVRLAPRQRAA